MANYETLLVRRDGPALVVTVNRPESLNALSEAVIAELRAVVNDARSRDDPGLRGLIITGAGEKAFVAGADIREMAAMARTDLDAYGADGQQLTLDLESLPIPVLAVVNGFALGGGCELALACDFIYATRNAAFGLPEVTLGLIPGFGGTVRLAGRVGAGVARELTYSGRRLGAADALRVGLVNAVFDTTDAALAAAKDTIGAIGANSRSAVARAKATIAAARPLSTENGLLVERGEFLEQFATPDGREGTSAFLEKRKPTFPSAG
ncbi:MAG TPA: enoyl-CoA hydratase-related protein [Galbitalea sp.]|jgi:enoyl-CoA hydratase|nr:enoyl-CoA hydratase-related protein [Galbitalea sp.]